MRTVTLGKNVKSVKAGALAKLGNATRLVVKTTKLTKKSVKGALKGTKITAVKVSVGSKKLNKAYVKKYGKLFVKKVCGRKVAVK